MNSSRSTCTFGAILLAACLVPSAAFGEAVYDNTVAPIDFFFDQAGLELGDEVNLGGVSRVVTEVRLGIAAESAGTVDLQLRIYDNAGAFTPPDTLLWESQIKDDFPLAAGVVERVSFDVPAVAVPDTLIYTLQISDNNTGGIVGPVVLDPPVVGTSGDWFWTDIGGWTPLFFGGDPVANLYALIFAGIHIDIKFCSDPNAFNCKKKGVLPVTVFGTDNLDVWTLDPGTFRLCLDPGVLSTCTGAPRGYSIADRGDPALDVGAAECAIVGNVEMDWLNQDGIDDLDIAFEASEVQELLGVFCDGGAKGDDSPTLYFRGETFDGTVITSAGIGDSGIDQLVKQN